MSTAAFLCVWTIVSAASTAVILGIFKLCADRERHWQDLEQTARETANINHIQPLTSTSTHCQHYHN